MFKGQIPISIETNCASYSPRSSIAYRNYLSVRPMSRGSSIEDSEDSEEDELPLLYSERKGRPQEIPMKSIAVHKNNCNGGRLGKCTCVWLSVWMVLFGVVLLARAISQAVLVDLVNTMNVASYYNVTKDGIMNMRVNVKRGYLSSISNSLRNGDAVSELEEDNKKILATIYSRLIDRDGTILVELMKGAHVIVQGDGGWYYGAFKRMGKAHHRISSHYSKIKQFSTSHGPVLSTLLVGETMDGNSWFQFEAAAWDPLHHPVDSIMHMVNYIEYKLRDVQVGPFGTSAYTDRNPLKLPYISYLNHSTMSVQRRQLT